MSLTDLILSRRSIRRYEAKKIPDEDVRSVLGFGRQSAILAANRQPVKFVFVTESELKKGLCDGLLIGLLKMPP